MIIERWSFFIWFFIDKGYDCYMGNRTPLQRGFTIVELLIVIVIIGILAALVIVAYNGIQQRANNAQTATTVTAYKKALIQYAVANGSYPANSNFCLGEGYPSGCGGSGGVAENAAVNNLLRPYMGNATKLPLPSTKAIPYIGPSTRTGAWFQYSGTWTLDGVAHYWYLMYMLDGYQKKCESAPVLSFSPYGTFSSTAPASGYSETYGSSGGGTFCVIGLPNPTTL